MERLLWNGSFLRCPGKNCQGIVERASEPQHGEVRAPNWERVEVLLISLIPTHALSKPPENGLFGERL